MMPSVFAELVGIPTAMIFVRNEHGSHNPDEAMALDDFAVATEALIGLARQTFPSRSRINHAMTLLVTGATGFVMSVLARHWLEAHPAEHLVIAGCGTDGRCGAQRYLRAGRGAD